MEHIVVGQDGTVYTAGQDGVVARLHGGVWSEVLRLEDDAPLRLALGGGALLVGTLGGDVLRVNLGTGEEEPFGEPLDGEIGGLASSDDAAVVAVSGGPEQVVELRNVVGGTTWVTKATGAPHVVRLTRDGRRLAVGTADGKLHVVETAALPDELVDLDVGVSPILDVGFLAGGRVAVVGGGAGGEGAVAVWGAGGAEVVFAAAPLFAVAVSPDGGRLVTGGNDQAVRLLLADTLEELGRAVLGEGGPEGGPVPSYEEHVRASGPAAVRALAFAPDGEHVWVGTEDGRVLELAATDFAVLARPDGGGERDEEEDAAAAHPPAGVEEWDDAKTEVRPRDEWEPPTLRAVETDGAGPRQDDTVLGATLPNVAEMIAQLDDAVQGLAREALPEMLSMAAEITTEALEQAVADAAYEATAGVTASDDEEALFVEAPTAPRARPQAPARPAAKVKAPPKTKRRAKTKAKPAARAKATARPIARAKAKAKAKPVAKTNAKAKAKPTARAKTKAKAKKAKAKAKPARAKKARTVAARPARKARPTTKPAAKKARTTGKKGRRR